MTNTDENKKGVSRVKRIISHKAFFPFMLFVMMLIAYGILMPWIGFYGDDWALIWNGYRMQNQDWIAFRPIVVWIYKILCSVLKPSFSQWLLVSIVVRWLGAFSLYTFLKEMMQDHLEEIQWLTILYALYPGFILYAPLTNIAPFFQPFFLFMSFYWMVLWMKKGPEKWYLFVASLTFAALNVFTTEYYFFFELLRPLIIGFVLRQEDSSGKTKQIFRTWLPYLVLFVLSSILRIGKINSISPYRSNLSTLTNDLPGFVARLWEKIIHDFIQVVVQPLVSSFQMPSDMGPRTLLIFLLVVCTTALIVLIYFLMRRKDRDLQAARHKGKPIVLILFGVVAFLMAGMPFWIADLRVEYAYSGLNRMAIPQALGFALLVVGLLLFVKRKQGVLAIMFISLLAGLFAGNQFRAADVFRSKWADNEKFFYNFSWRIPDLKPGTIIILNSSGMGDNALAAALNWHYVDEEQPAKIDYYVYQDEDHLNSDIPGFHQNQDVSNYHIIGSFEGTTDQVLVLHFEQDECLRVIDPQIDQFNPDITDFSREYFRYSNSAVILADTYMESGEIDTTIYSDKQPNWCYYFEKADLARQLGDWASFADIGGKAFSVGEHAGNAAEFFPFIEGYAHIDNWERAIQLTDEVIQISEQYARMTCALWERIESETTDSVEKMNAMDWLNANLACDVY